MRYFVLLSLFVVLFAVGCSPSKPSDAGGSEAAQIVFIPKNTGNPFFDQLAAGIEAGGVKFDTQGPATNESTSQISIIKDQVQRGADVIIISANDPAALNETLDQARAKGVTVITVDSDLTGNEDHRDLAVLSTDFSLVGPAQLELLAEQLNYEGEFAILSATKTAPNQNAWIAGMQEALKDAKYAKMKLVAVVYGDDEAQKSSTETEALISKYPNLRGIIAPTTAGIAAAAQALENAGMYPGGPKAKNGGIVLTGLGMPNEMREAVEKGVVAKFQLWDPADMGKIAAYVGPQMHAGKLKPKPGDEIDVPGFGKVKVNEKNVIFAGPLFTFDKSNIGNYHF